nr:hypothetical protein [Tanacetum cinerariifolium]
MAFVSSSNNNNTNRAVNTAQPVNAAFGVSTADTQVNTYNIDNLSDAVICAFMASQPSSPQLVNKDLEQIHPDDLKEMDLRWQMAMLTMRARRKLEVALKEKEGIQLTVDKLENASKSLNKLIDCHIVDNCKKGLRYENYNAVPHPYTRNFMYLKPDLSYIGLDEFANKPVVENKSSEEVTKAVRKNPDAPIVEDWVSDEEKENVTQPKIVMKTVKHSIPKIEFVKPRQQEKKAMKTVKKNDHHYHQQQFKNQKMVKLVWNYNQMVNHKFFAKKTHPHAKRNMAPRAVVLKSGIVNTAEQKISKTTVLVNAARQVSTAHPKSTVNAAKQKVNTVRNKTVNSNTARPKAVVNVVQGNVVNAVKASAYYEEIDRGYVAFKCNLKGGKITRKCTIRTAEMRNMTLIEAARTMLADLKIPTTFWAEAVNTAFYVQNRVLVVKPHNKTPYEFFMTADPPFSKIQRSSQDDGFQPSTVSGKKVDEDPSKGSVACV